jgi:transposase
VNDVNTSPSYESMIESHDTGDESRAIYQCIKTSLKSVVKKDVADMVISKLMEASLRANGIMTHTLQFLKLYIIHCYDSKIPLPKIDRQFVTSIMKVLCVEPSQGRPPSVETKILKDRLQEFFEQQYQPRMTEKLNYRHLNTVLDYLSTDIITMYENNIKQHYVEYVERFVNVVWRKKELLTIIKKKRSISSKKTVDQKKEAINKLCRQLRHIKNDLLRPDQAKTSHNLYHEWIDEQRLKITPARVLSNNDINYDIQCSPQDYLHPMLYMMKSVELFGTSVYNVCPLRSSIVPKHFRLDTVSLVNLCFTKEQGNRQDYVSKGNLVKRQDEIWGFFFKTEKKCFHVKEDSHAFTFDHQIETDGVSCSILLKQRKKESLDGDHAKTPKRKKRRVEKKVEKYIDELVDYEPLNGKRVVAIDPNMSDLLYCVNSDAKDQVKFRYTQDTRRKETKAKKYRNYLQKRKNDFLVEGKSIVLWENELSAFNKKTTDFEAFKDYIAMKNDLNNHLAPFYNEYIFRKLKLGSYIRRQITESRLLKRFKTLFGSGEETIVAIGDWEQHQHRKFKEPIKGKGFRTLFRKAGYEVYLVDEFRTSCRCSACSGECEKFRICKNPRPNRSGNILRHGLIKCKTCSRLWNRDTNAASNIWKIAMSAIRGEERPEYLQRARGSSSGTINVGTHK